MADHTHLDVMHCPHCDYDLTGLPDATTCPECGKPITADDRRFQVRRQVFLRLTCFTPWWHAAVLIAIGLFSYAWPLVFYVPGLLVGLIWIAGVKGTQARVVRRMWMMNLFWLQLPWVLPALGYRALTFWLWNWGWGSWIGDAWEYESGFRLWYVVILAAAGAVAAIPLWRWRWRRLTETAGVTAEAADLKDAGLRIALRLSFWPVLFPVLLVLIFQGLIELADTIFGPNWPM